MTKIIEEETDPLLLRKIVTNLHVKIFDDYETVIKISEQPDQIFFIDQGQVNVIDCTGLFVLAVLRKGSFFGEYQVIH